jgi:flotillin
LPALVEAASRGIAGSNLTVLNGAQGVNELLAGLVGQGLSILELLRNSTAVTTGELPPPDVNGKAAPKTVYPQ